MGRKRQNVRPHGRGIQIDFMYCGNRYYEQLDMPATSANLNYAERFVAEIKDEIRLGTFSYLKHFPKSKKARSIHLNQGGLPIPQELEKWLGIKRREGLHHSTLVDYQNSVNILGDYFHGYFIPELTRKDIRKFCDSIEAGQKRIANLLIPLRGILDQENEDDDNFKNPIKGWKYKKRSIGRKRDSADPFDSAEREAILKACNTDLEYHYFRIAMYSGMRPSEQICLLWEDVSADYIHIRQGSVHRVVDEPKTHGSIRDIPMVLEVKESIAALKLLTRLKPHGHVFEHPNTGRPFTTSKVVYNIWQPIIKRSGVRYREPKQTRHTFASMLLSAGRPPIQVSSLMGHSDTTMVLRVYGKWIDEGREKLARNLSQWEVT